MMDLYQLHQEIEDFIKTITWVIDGETCGVPEIIWPNTKPTANAPPYWKVSFDGAQEQTSYVDNEYAFYRDFLQIDIVVKPNLGDRGIDAQTSAVFNAFMWGKEVGIAKFGAPKLVNLGSHGTGYRYVLTIPFTFGIKRPQP